MHTQLAGLIELLCDLDEVRAADEANNNLLAQLLQERNHVGQSRLLNQFSDLYIRQTSLRGHT